MEFFVCEQSSIDGDGSKAAPFKHIDDVFQSLNTTSEQKIDYKIFSNCPEGFKEVSKAQIKKSKKTFLTKSTKSSKEVVQCLGDKFVTVTIDNSLPEAIFSEINKAKSLIGKRVLIKGWVQHIRKQSKKLWFLKLRDGTGFLQCVLENKLCNTKDASHLLCETSVSIYGMLREYPEGSKTSGIELVSDYWEMIGQVHKTGGIESILNADSDPDVLFNNRHLMIRGENSSKIIVMQDVALRAFRRHFEKQKFRETLPPTLVQSQCEGGSTLFKFDYFGEEAYLSQSSQLYLETLNPAISKCYAITRSFRAEKSRTRRHLSEYNHIEAESAFITFEDLLNQIEDLLVDVSELVLEIDRETVLEINPNYKPLQRPFIRMEYKDAIAFLAENGIEKPEGGGAYEFGDDIPEAAERKMTDIIQKPIMLIKFPAGLKAFYMSRCPEDNRLTESVDVLIPGVGEIVGGSMRIWDYKELLDGYASNDLNPDDYYFYTDMRIFGSVPHGGYGLGFERFLTWMLDKDHIREVCLYPRYIGRCTP